MSNITLPELFAGVTDPRKKNVTHPLINILTIAFTAVLCGADDWVTIALFGESKRKFFEKLLDLNAGIPAHDTFSDIFNRLNPVELSNVLARWAEALSTEAEKHLAIDGKTMRRAWDKSAGGKPLHILNAWGVMNGVCFGHHPVEGKSNEITVLPFLLRMLDLDGATVTTDALMCQKTTTEQIKGQGGEYILALKENHATFYHEVVELFEGIRTGKINCSINMHEDVSGEHGRIEIRRTWVTPYVDWFAEKNAWAGLKCFAMVERETCQKGGAGTPTIERRYFISSHSGEDAALIARFVRGHWQIENGLHWQLDVSFNEDKQRSRSGHAAANLSLLNKLALSTLKHDKSVKAGVKSKRLKAGWDDSYLLKLLGAIRFD